jgi:hypothetical protein
VEFAFPGYPGVPELLLVVTSSFRLGRTGTKAIGIATFLEGVDFIQIVDCSSNLIKSNSHEIRATRIQYTSLTKRKQEQ